MKTAMRRPWVWPATIILAAGSTFGSGARQTDRDWEGSATLCGVSFKIMRNEWVVVATSGASSTKECTGEIRHKLYDKLVAPRDPEHFWKISISVHAQPFEQLKHRYDIRQENGRWFVGPGALAAPAYEIAGPDWWGLRADSVPYRGYARVGGDYVGASEAIWAVISSTLSQRTAMLIAGSGADDAPLPLLLNSFRFDPVR